MGDISNYRERVTILWPENYDQFPSTYPTNKLLYYSPYTLNKIKKIIEGKQAYIVPGYPSKEDFLLGIFLKVPILSGNYLTV